MPFAAISALLNIFCGSREGLAEASVDLILLDNS